MDCRKCRWLKTASCPIIYNVDEQSSPDVVYCHRFEEGKMFIIEKTFKIPMGHRLSKHKGLCQNFHGHNFVIKVEVCSKTLDGNDMVIDFSELKRIVNRILENFDHCMLLNDKDPMKSEFCKGYRVQIFPGDPTAEMLCQYFFDRISSEVKVLLGTEVKLVSVSIWENDDSMAKYVPD